MKSVILLAGILAALLVAACEIPRPGASPTNTPPPQPAAQAEATPAGPAAMANPAMDVQVPGTPTPRLMQLPGGGSYMQYAAPPLMTIDTAANYSASIRTNQGSMTVQLFASNAPKTVNNFIFLAREGFYNGLIFHRVIPQFMIQGGDPTGTGSGGPGYKFEDEIFPDLQFGGAGVLAMANAGPNTNGSQFFITVAPTPHLTGSHTIFGRVVDGQNVATAISLVPTARANRPEQPVVIEAIEITGP